MTVDEALAYSDGINRDYDFDQIESADSCEADHFRNEERDAVGVLADEVRRLRSELKEKP